MEDEKELLNELLGYINEYHTAVKKIPTEPYKVTINYKYFELYDKLTKDYNLPRCAHITPEGCIYNITQRLEELEPKVVTTPTLEKIEPNE